MCVLQTWHERSQRTAARKTSKRKPKVSEHHFHSSHFLTRPERYVSFQYNWSSSSPRIHSECSKIRGSGSTDGALLIYTHAAVWPWPIVYLKLSQPPTKTSKQKQFEFQKKNQLRKDHCSFMVKDTKPLESHLETENGCILVFFATLKSSSITSV